MRGRRLGQCPRVRRPPLGWLLDWIRIPARNAFFLTGLFFIVQGISMARESPGWVTLLGFALAVVLCMGTAAALNRRLPGRLALSLAVASMAILTVGSGASLLFSSDPIYRARSHTRIDLMHKALPTILGFPVAPTTALILWSFAVDVASLEMMAHYFGDPRSFRIYLTTLVSTLFWLGFAVLESGRLCSMFEAQSALTAEKELMEAMMKMMCDATIWLSEDCQTVLGLDDRLKMILGRDVTGEDVCDSLAEDERRRLKDSLQRAKTAPLLLPSTLVTQGGCRIPVDMFIVGNRSANAAGKAGPLPAFLIGVRVGEYHASAADPRVDDTSTNPPVQYQPEGSGRIALEDGQSVGAPSSVPETTATGRVFERIRGSPEDQSGEMQQKLEAVLALGEKERWLLDPADLKVAASEVLGEGAFGVVVPGWFHGSPVAVKVTKDKAECAAAQRLVAIATEVQILRHVRHPNVVLFHGACVEPEEGELALVLERVKGPNLSEYIEGHASDSDACKRFQLLLDIACALRYLHSLRPQVVHGDLKGHNILVEPSLPRAKLLDFGISRMLTKKARPLGGSLPWMAPEIICKHAEKPRPSADVFSFGRIVCLITTCKKPLAGLHYRAIVSMAHRGVTHLNLWEHGRPLHDEGRQLCERLLSYAPEDRPTASEAHRKISAWAPPLAGEEMPALELARAADADCAGPDGAGARPPADTLSSLWRVLRSGAAESEQARQRPGAGRASRRPAVLEGVCELEGCQGTAHHAAPQLATLCSL